MKKIVLLPLDERPCNVKFPVSLFRSAEREIAVPQRLGNKKEPAKFEDLTRFLDQVCADADGLVVSLDMLLYGGLIPSRLHYLEESQLCTRIQFLRQLKERYPSLKIYGFDCIMRCPTYSSDDEEPDYYAEFGAQIHALGVARHKESEGDRSQQQKAEALEREIPGNVLEDYLFRRKRNLRMNVAALDLVLDGTIDFMVIPQDDAAPYGFTAMDQMEIRAEIKKRRIQNRVMLYPGADEVAMTLLARMENVLAGRNPAVYPLYASGGASFVIPPYEDRPLSETVRCQIVAAGCHVTAAPEQADVILAITAPAGSISAATSQSEWNGNYDVGRSLTAFFSECCYWMDMGKPVTVCDNAYCNGGDLELLSMLDVSARMMDVAGYAGWNTSSNTMGTAIAQGVRYLYRGRDAEFLDFLALRYVEDCAYDAAVRQIVTQEDLPEMGLNYFRVDAIEGVAAERVKSHLCDFVQEHMASVADHIVIHRVGMPWVRMFEVDLDVEYCP